MEVTSSQKRSVSMEKMVCKSSKVAASKVKRENSSNIEDQIENTGGTNCSTSGTNCSTSGTNCSTSGTSCSTSGSFSTGTCSTGSTMSGIPPECFGCHKVIKERFLLQAVDHLWHEDCLKCACCDCRLGEVGSTLFTKANLILCKRDYLRLFGTTGHCAACNKTIPAFEMVMRAKGNVYHLECFACQQCNHRFCVGDRFYLFENKVLCEYDYEERMVFASLPQNVNSLDHIKRQTNELLEVGSDGTSSGYGSHSESPFTNDHR